MNKPNFFIVGAAKCGTTALSEYLRQHPEIHMSWPKEPHYFAYDLENYRFPKTEQEYLSLFDVKDPELKIFGEASVFYLYSEVALNEVKNYAPDAKIVALFRNPADMLYSLHSQLMYSRDENVEDFQKAWELCEKRKQGKNVPKQCREAKILFYDELAKFGSQCEKLLNTFDKSQVMIFLFEDFVKDPKSVHDKIINFLGLQVNNKTEFEKVNERRAHKLKWLSILTQRPPRMLDRPVKWLKNVLGIQQIGLLDFLRKKNLSTQPRPPLSAELKAEITEHYRSEILKLSELTGRNLDHWLRP